MTIQTIDARTYEAERAICDTAAAYAERVMSEGGAKRKRNYITKEEAAAPEYAACDNDMRGRVEQFELLRDLPDSFGAYLSSQTAATIGGNDYAGKRFNVGVWTGLPLGVATVQTVGKANRYGERTLYGRAVIGGKRYSWRGQGGGMIAHFRAVKGS